MEVRKEIIRTGRHVYIDQDGKPAVLDTTRDKINHYLESGRKMIEAGLPIPVPLEHDTNANPLNAADLAAGRVKNNTGFVKSYETDTIKDAKTGEEIHRLLSVLDIKDDKAAEKIKNQTIPFVSPWINSFRDGTGKEWNEVISHVALTTRPRIHSQQPFESVGKALSLVTPMKAMPKEGIALSRCGLLKKDGKLKYPVFFSLMSGVKLSDEELEEVAKEEEAEPAGEKSGERESPLDSVGAKPEVADLKIHEIIGHMLKALGYNPPDGMSEETFERDIYETLMAKIQELGTKQKEPESTPETPPEQKSPIVQEEPPMMYMSLTADQIQAIKDPAQKAQAEAFLSLRTENEKNKAIADAVTKNILESASQRRQARIERICKRVPAVARDRILRALNETGAQLSLNTDGTVRDPMATMLEVFEAGLPDLPAMLKGEIKLSEQSHPDDSGNLTDEQAAKLADQMVNRHAPVKQSA